MTIRDPAARTTTISVRVRVNVRDAFTKGAEADGMEPSVAARQMIHLAVMHMLAEHSLSDTLRTISHALAIAGKADHVPPPPTPAGRAKG